MKQPHEYPKRTLFAVIGMTPQIVTESLYVLAVKQQPAFVPTDIKIVTTKAGAEEVRQKLLVDGWFERLCKEYGLEGIQFSEQDVLVITHPDGYILEDIREIEDNEIMADLITNVVRGLTSDEDRAVHVSIAGGRKTMGYYAGYALSLFGRDQDRLSHVLVDAAYENSRDFYYPSKPVPKGVSPSKEPLAEDTSNAKITLAEIPFVNLRNGLPKKLSGGKATFIHTVEVVKRIMGPTEIVFDVKNQRVVCAGENINLPAREYAFYLWMAKRKINNLPAIRGLGKNMGIEDISDEDITIAKDYLEVHEKVVGEFSGHYDTVEKNMRHEAQDENTPEHLVKYRMKSTFIQEQVSHIKTELSVELGEKNIDRYFINKIGKKSETRYEFAAESDNIHIK